MSHSQVQPDAFSYSASMSACEKCGQWQEALRLFHAMPFAHLQPDVFCYSAAMSACDKGGAWEEALRLFRAMPEVAVQPNVVSYTAAIRAFEKAGHWREALKVFGSMSGRVRADEWFYSALVLRTLDDFLMSSLTKTDLQYVFFLFLVIFVLCSLPTGRPLFFSGLK